MQVADLFASLSLKPDAASWAQGDKLIRGVKAGLGFFAGVEVVKAIGEQINAVQELGSKLHDTSQKTGLSVEALQEYGYIAKQNSSDLDSFANAVGKMGKGLDEAFVKGSGPAYEALGRLHIQLSNFKKLTLDEKVTALAVALNKVNDPIKKSALAADLFGKSGRDLIPTLNQIAEEGASARQEFKDLGGEISGDQAAALDDFGDELDKAKAQITGVKTSIVLALLPALKSMLDGAMAWIKANRAIITSGIEAVVTGIGYAFTALGYAIDGVVAVVRFFQEHSEIARATLIALGAVLGAVALEAAAAWVIGFAPVILVIAAIAALILVLDDVWQGISEGKGVTAAIFQFIADKVRAFGRHIVDAFNSVKDFFVSIGNWISDSFHSALNWVEDKIDFLWEKAKKLAHYAAHPQDAVGDAVDYFTGNADTSGTPKAAADSIMAPSANGPARSMPSSGPVTQPGQSVTVDARISVNVDATGMEPSEARMLIDRQIQAHTEKTWRDVHAATGGEDEPHQ